MGKLVGFTNIKQDEMQTDLRSLFRGAIRMTLETLLEEEVRDLVGAERYKRVVSRKGQRNGSYLRGLLTSMGHIEVKVPRTRDGSPVDVLGRYQRRMENIDEMVTEAYIQGVSQRDVSQITESLCGEKVSKSTASRIAKRLAMNVEELHAQKFSQAHPYLYLDATYIKARWARKLESACVLLAYGVNEDGFRELLGVQVALSESGESWGGLLKDLVARGLHGVELVISDDHAGLDQAVRHHFPEIPHQRCTVHLQRNVAAHVPRRLQKRVLGEVGRIFKAESKVKAAQKLVEFEKHWGTELPEAIRCLQNGFDAATQFYKFPKAHHRRIHTTNTLERLNGELKRRSRAVGQFPDRQSALRLLGTIAIQVAAKWANRRYLDITLMRKEETEQKAA